MAEISKVPSKSAQIRDAILRNESLKGQPEHRSTKQLAQDLGVDIAFVYSQRARLKDKVKHYQDPYFKNFADPRALQKVVEEEAVLTPLERIKVLSRLIRTAAPLVKIAAIKALEELTKQESNRLGVPPPLSEDDRVARYTRLFLATGYPTVHAALQIAFPDQYPNAPPDPTTAAIVDGTEEAPALWAFDGAISAPPPIPEGPLPDLPDSPDPGESSSD